MNDDLQDHSEHLTEEERQAMADGSLPADRARAAARHIARCAECADDVSRLRDFLIRAAAARTDDPLDAAAADAAWPALRSRIDQRKEAPLEQAHRSQRAASAAQATTVARPNGRIRRRVVGGIVAAACVAAIALAAEQLTQRHAPIAPVKPSPPPTPQVVASVPAADSVGAYQEEARTLLDELELRRAVLRPDALSAIDHDLVVVDSAITELESAIARDPKNPALRQLLASTYRQKIEVLKRMGNAG